MKKTMKKLASLALVLVMALALAVPALATEGGEGDGGSESGTTGNESTNTTSQGPGTITLKNPEGVTDSTTFNVYRVFDLTLSGDIKDNNGEITGYSNYSYTASSAVKTLIDSITENSPYAAVKDYFTFTDIGGGKYTVTPKTENSFNSEAAAKTFSQFLAQDTSPLTSIGAVTVNGQTPATINVPYGYYFVDSTVGSLCMLDSTNPSVTITDKNKEPIPDKTVTVQDGTDRIGTDVEYTIEIPIKEGAKDYVLSDVMSNGLTFKQDTLTVKIKEGDNAILNTDYTVVYPDDSVTGGTKIFEITFMNTFLNGHQPSNNVEAVIVVTYSATINENAVTVNGNEATLNYGSNHTVSDGADVPLYGFGLKKVTGTGENEQRLDGAKFKLYDAATGGNEIKVVAVDEADTAHVGYDYIVAVDQTTTNGVEIEAGDVKIFGLYEGTYYLEEVEAPAGYNKLAERVQITIKKDETATDTSAKDTVYVWTMGTETNEDGETETKLVKSGIANKDGLVTVVNYTGSELPSTGGMGTKIFTIGGSILVVGAAVLLITKKRMGSDN